MYNFGIVVFFLSTILGSHGYTRWAPACRTPERTTSTTAAVAIMDFVSKRAVHSVSSLVNLVSGIINKILAGAFGFFSLILYYVPTPRLTQWCPPYIPLFDMLIALSIGLILYVLILWAAVAWFGSDADDAGDAVGWVTAPAGAAPHSTPKGSNDLSRIIKCSDETLGESCAKKADVKPCCCSSGPSASASAPVISGRETKGQEETGEAQGQLRWPRGENHGELKEEGTAREEDAELTDENEWPFKGDRIVIDIGPTSGSTRGSHSKQGSLYSYMRQNRLKTVNEYLERGYRLAIDKRDSVDIPPANYQTVETQVRPKARAEGGRVSKSIEHLQRYTRHIVDISPEEAIPGEIVESDYSGSVTSVFSDHPFCDHCGADYCDDGLCPCGPGSHLTGSSDNHANNIDAEERCRDNDNNDETPAEHVDRFNDVAQWVNRIHLDHERVGSRDGEHEIESEPNVNNNNGWLGRTESDCSSETLMASRARGSSTDSSEYTTAEEDIDFQRLNNPIPGRASTSDLLAEGDGLSIGSSRWRRKRRPEALVQKETSGGDGSAVGYPFLASSFSEEESDLLTNEMSTERPTTIDTMISSLRSDIPSTTDGVALISPPPLTLHSTSSEAELSLAQQLQAATKPRVILEGGGDCKISELNNRHSFMESYQMHLFQKTAVHVFGTANLENFYEQT